jgi:hypothetical protein
MRTSDCSQLCEDFRFFKVDQIVYGGLLPIEHDRMYCFHFPTSYFTPRNENVKHRLILRTNNDVFHYLQVKEKKDRFLFELTTGLEKKYSLRLDVLFVVSPGIISRWLWDEDESAIINKARFSHQRPSRQFSYMLYRKEYLMSFSDLYIVLVIRKECNDSTIINIFNH